MRRFSILTRQDKQVTNQVDEDGLYMLEFWGQKKKDQGHQLVTNVQDNCEISHVPYDSPIHNLNKY